MPPFLPQYIAILAACGLLLSVFSLLFFCQMSNEIFIIFDFVAVCMLVLAKVNDFYVSPKTQNFSSKFGSTHSCSISALIHYLVYIVCCFATKLIENTK